MNNSTIGKNKKIATGWLMVIACMLVQAIPYCIVANTQALYMYPVMEAKGFTLSQFSLIFTIGTIVPALIGILNRRDITILWIYDILYS